ncbi:MAG: putative metalloprotease CJM1_0395 family protein [Alphaproteobacteria bacterium]
MLPAIGSIGTLAGQGRTGVVVGAQPIGEPENGRQLVALRIRESDRAGGTGLDARGSADQPGKASRPAAAAGEPAPSARRPSSVARLPNELSPTEKATISQLQQRDQQVRQEEEAHAAVAGDLAGPINYVYQRGPDGRHYAVGGSVGIRSSVVSGDPEEAKRQAGRIAAAANAATNPSAQDYAAARKAYAQGSQLGLPTTPDDGTAGVDLAL